MTRNSVVQLYSCAFYAIVLAQLISIHCIIWRILLLRSLYKLYYHVSKQIHLKPHNKFEILNFLLKLIQINEFIVWLLFNLLHICLKTFVLFYFILFCLASVWQKLLKIIFISTVIMLFAEKSATEVAFIYFFFTI